MKAPEPETAIGELIAAIEQTPAILDLVKRVEKGGVLSFEGVSGSARPFLAALIHQVFPTRPLVVVTAGVKAQEAFQQDLETWWGSGGDAKTTASETAAGESRLLYFPSWEVLPRDDKLPHSDIISERLETLVRLSRLARKSGQARAPIITTSVTALMQQTFSPEILKQRIRFLRKGDQMNPLDLIEWLEDQGYEPEAQVTAKGEIALRGGIVDVYAPPSPWPVRLEFFGDELESLRYFDPITQISREETGSVAIPPAGEFGLLKRLLDRPDNSAPALATLLDYLPPDSLILISDPEELDEHAEEYTGQISPDDPFFAHWPQLREIIRTRNFTEIECSENVIEESDDLGFRGLEAFRPIAEKMPDIQIQEAQRGEFFNQLHRWQRQGFAVNVFCNNEGERQRFEEISREHGLGGTAGTKRPAQRRGSSWLSVRIGALSRGFVFEPGKLVVVTDAEIFGRYKIQRPRRMKSPHAQATRSALDIDFSDLEEGDYVVHLQHGIGRYLGLTVIASAPGKSAEGPDGGSRGQECLTIEYAPSRPDQPPPKLYVPMTEAHLVSKYVGAGKARPQLHRLGGARWHKAKQDAEKAVEDLAAQFLSIQARREALSGHTFQADTTWQREFESSFLFEETPHQRQAIEETKGDMEKPKPMDRLICGDVGYGKTEVAIRAAFKAVMDGKQVAVLVPTTVLAQQHFVTFSERMADYPVRIELLSRFRSRKHQSRVVADLAAGSVDIIIGTHRLIQKDVAFKDLGLVIIDEEQRFGVLHKEKFKQLRALVDVLTLSATPIPRTLYLALTGARDMSTIETPPQDRLPVQTFVIPFDEEVIRNAIQREINREGQVFFLHNRVNTIDAMAERIQSLAPHARVLVGHGQMHSDDLEKIMTQFVNGDADVLLSTTIIESGIDIPNANTIIIDRADRFGLSQLYQLRGRVGRYKHQAYAYLLLPRHARLLSDVRKRMSAIKQYSSLGSGFKIAMRDLEIRGAGNLLGPQQSGHITAVGFDLYCQLLKQSVARLKGESPPKRVEVQVRLDFLDANPRDNEVSDSDSRSSSPAPKSEFRVEHSALACIPYHYIRESRHRIEIYRKLAQITDKAELRRLETEVRDRFGPLPPPAEMLLAISELKLLAAERAVTGIETRGDKLMLTRNNDYLTVSGKFPRLAKKTPHARLKEIRRFLSRLQEPV